MRYCMNHISAIWTDALPQNGKAAQALVAAAPLFGTGTPENKHRLIV